MSTLTESQRAQRAYQLDRAHVFHSWSAQDEIDPMVVSGGEGSYIWDGAGRRYLDFSSQLIYTNLGHQHPAMVAGIQEQAARLCTLAPKYAIEARSEAAHLIAQVMPDGLERTFFTNAGADAIEHAVRMARCHTGRRKVLTQYRSYHGATELAVQMTGDPRRWASDHGNAGVVHFFGPFLYRSAFHATTEEEECSRALEHLERVIEMEGSDTIAALVLETIPGSVGLLPPPAGYLAGVRELCDRFGILYIADEVMTGFGRTGEWLGIDRYRVTPDLVVFAKGVTSGYVPLGGVTLADHVARTFAHRAYPGGLTYSGHPLACAAAVTAINVMREEKVPQNSARIGDEVLGPGLAALAARHPSVGDVRGMATFWVLELVADRETKRPMVAYGSGTGAMERLEAACLDGGLVVYSRDNCVYVTPPCTVGVEEARAGLDALDEALCVADEAVTGAG